VAAPYPPKDEVQSKLQAIVEEKRAYVRSQVIWRYRERLPSGLAEPTKEQQADAWFDKQWSDETWRLAMSPGKLLLAELREWCSRQYKLTVTTAALVKSLNHVPPELEAALRRVNSKLGGAP
jgi:hypothetical protein